MQNIYEASAANRRKSTIVLILFIAFVAMSLYVLSIAFSLYMGYRPGGLGIFGIAMIVSGIIGLISYYYSDKIILSISNARPADRQRDFEFYTVSENLSIASGLPKPRLYVIEDPAPNAFTTGRNPENAIVVATSGLLKKLNRTELEGVVAHELSHIKNYDMRLMSVVAVLVGTVALLADLFLRMSLFGGGRRDRGGKMDLIFMVLGLLFAILSPIVAQLIKLAISRRREFLADAGAVFITRQPSGLISALEKIATDNLPLKAANKATAHLYIENPFKNRVSGASGWFSGLFNTHPPVSERVGALKKMS
jgi:heat shock protein HtpX